MRQYFSFEGESRREVYWAVTVINLLIGAVMVPIIVAGATAPDMHPLTFLAIVILLSPLWVGPIWLQLATGARRCREAGINPFWSATVFLPYIAVIPVAVIGLLPPVNRGADRLDYPR
ncbi:DUF805 domain-containing protein [Spiribacter vilamensis]|uniref:Uncharacterized membrane protein YhaH (DUF805 family) n=1 Tax=Spiribacter vilamensis TaxID=531306 RepID=A0A4Q8D076_9GAMM|nr:DUF805 domain-containing protein [Spiribacter vilamensis]RZU98617.1 uncharacterized membrane protein YhaH (DUF805 family) [Spiribacter vilamensis]TVO60125.1 DUF805 domain-containing protein [Spiribacter vilamensis]